MENAGQDEKIRLMRDALTRMPNGGISHNEDGTFCAGGGCVPQWNRQVGQYEHKPECILGRAIHAARTFYATSAK
jgi:hypothetical protein